MFLGAKAIPIRLYEINLSSKKRIQVFVALTLQRLRLPVCDCVPEIKEFLHNLPRACPVIRFDLNEIGEQIKFLSGFQPLQVFPMRNQLWPEPIEERFNIESPKNQTSSELMGGGFCPLLARSKQAVSCMP